ncbi:hypothetical protein EYF80_021045 [Liparis tanakae]|uniref:Uncharacterized protein n=1 Tax=Liparis tanakae TaxID=230148 RepID=A0A4Z2HUU5_9TELE|nr:hypothetical protein EYF80_021045 [Liparis tanakae]
MLKDRDGLRMLPPEGPYWIVMTLAPDGTAGRKRVGPGRLWPLLVQLGESRQFLSHPGTVQTEVLSSHRPPCPACRELPKIQRQQRIGGEAYGNTEIQRDMGRHRAGFYRTEMFEQKIEPKNPPSEMDCVKIPLTKHFLPRKQSFRQQGVTFMSEVMINHATVEDTWQS